MQKFILMIENWGNKLPHPVMLFILLWATVIVVAHVTHIFQWQTNHPTTNELILTNTLLSVEGIGWWLSHAISSFTGFAPVGPVLVVMLGIGIAERSGFFSAVLTRLLPKQTRFGLTAAVVLVGILSSLAFDAGYVVVIPMSALLFHAAGRSPLLGIAASFAAVSGGFSANLLIGPVDIMLSGITTDSAQIIDSAVMVPAVANWYFMAASVLLLLVVITFVVEYYLASLPIISDAHNRKSNEDLEHSGQLEQNDIQHENTQPKSDVNDTVKANSLNQTQAIANYTSQDTAQHNVTSNNKVMSTTIDVFNPHTTKALWIASTIFIVFMLSACWGIFSDNSPFANGVAQDGKSPSPLLQNISVVLGVGFILCGSVYGWLIGRYRNRLWVKDLEATWIHLVPYLILMFFAAQFISTFSWTNLGLIMAIKGADVLGDIGTNTYLMMTGLIVLTAFINLVVGSASAKWALLAPVFVPMLMIVGISPDMTQVAYRIGDSSTNIITPLMPYFPLILVLMQQYRSNAGVGTLMALMLPLAISMLCAWVIFLLFWISMGWPIGPR